MNYIKLEKTKEAPESSVLMAKSVVQVAEAFEKLNKQKGGLTKRALVVLLQDGIGSTYITKGQIKLVLEVLPRLKGWYVKK